MENLCDVIQDSIDWCEGRPNFAGMEGRIYYIANKYILQFPERETTESGTPLASYKDKSNFLLKADKHWLHIDIQSAKSQPTSESQGEFPSISQLNKLTAILAGTGEKQANAAAYINNIPCTFLFKDMEGNFRVIGCEKWKNENQATVAMDLGQGSAGTANTTLTIQAPDFTPFPIYRGEVDEGELGE